MCKCTLVIPLFLFVCDYICVCFVFDRYGVLCFEILRTEYVCDESELTLILKKQKQIVRCTIFIFYII